MLSLKVKILSSNIMIDYYLLRLNRVVSDMQCHVIPLLEVTSNINNNNKVQVGGMTHSWQLDMVVHLPPSQHILFQVQHELHPSCHSQRSVLFSYLHYLFQYDNTFYTIFIFSTTSQLSSLI